MANVTHQTVRLARGKHRSPHEGVCVMELASMLAGGAFTDHPRSVSRVLAAFLRAYNDRLDDRRRQDLYPVAANVVGTWDPAVELVRTDLLLSWCERRCPRPWYRPIATARFRRKLRGSVLSPQGTANLAVHIIGRIDDRVHRDVLELIDEIIAVGRTPPASAPAALSLEQSALRESQTACTT